MSIYAVVLLAHVAGAIALLAGLTIISISLWRMTRAVSIVQLRTWAGLASKADTLLPVGAALILLSGLYMLVAVWGWRHGWVNVSLAALLLAGPLVPAIIAPRLAALHRAAGGIPEGPVPASIQAATHDPALWTSVSVMTTGSVGIAVLMLTKPPVLWSITAVAVALLAGLAVAGPAWRRRRGPVSAPPDRGSAYE